MSSHHEKVPRGFNVPLGAKGRLVLPAPLRRLLGVREGDRLVATAMPDGTVRIMKASDVSRRGFGLFAHVAPERDLSSELIAERRGEDS